MNAIVAVVEVEHKVRARDQPVVARRRFSPLNVDTFRHDDHLKVVPDTAVFETRRILILDAPTRRT